MTNPQQLKERIYALNPELKARIPKDLPLPVKYDGINYYWGNNAELIADFDEGVNTGDGFRIRGWGRIQDEKSQDECAKYIEQAINAYSDIELSHVLRAIIESVGYRTRLEVLIETPPVVTQRKEGIFRSGQYIIKLLEQYDLTKTFDQNIAENEELVAFLLNIIK